MQLLAEYRYDARTSTYRKLSGGESYPDTLPASMLAVDALIAPGDVRSMRRAAPAERTWEQHTKNELTALRHTDFPKYCELLEAHEKKLGYNIGSVSHRAAELRAWHQRRAWRAEAEQRRKGA